MASESNGYAGPNAKAPLIWIEFSSREVEKVSQLFLLLYFHLEVKLLSKKFAERCQKCVSLEESPRTTAQRLSVGGY